MSVKVYYAVKSAHYKSNRYIYESLSLAENQVAKLKKDYPRDDVKIERLVVGEDYDKLEARCKELEEENRILKAKLKKALGIIEWSKNWLQNVTLEKKLRTYTPEEHVNYLLKELDSIGTEK